MEINESIFKLIGELEYIIGNQVYSKSYINAGGCFVNDYQYRYPVRVSLNGNKNVSRDKVNYKVHEELLYRTYFNRTTNEWVTEPFYKPSTDMASIIDTMYYAFGAHYLYIGDGLVKILEFLENRYGINFNQLEEKLQGK